MVPDFGNSSTEERRPMGWRCRFNPGFPNYILSNALNFCMFGLC